MNNFVKIFMFGTRTELINTEYEIQSFSVYLYKGTKNSIIKSCKDNVKERTFPFLKRKKAHFLCSVKRRSI